MVDYEIPEDAILYLIDAHGQYIPEIFAQTIDRAKTQNITEEQFSALEAGPNSEHYWDVWDEIERNGVILHENQEYTIYLDGDLFFIPKEGK